MVVEFDCFCLFWGGHEACGSVLWPPHLCFLRKGHSDVLTQQEGDKGQASGQGFPHPSEQGWLAGWLRAAATPRSRPHPRLPDARLRRQPPRAPSTLPQGFLCDPTWLRRCLLVRWASASSPCLTPTFCSSWTCLQGPAAAPAGRHQTCATSFRLAGHARTGAASIKSGGQARQAGNSVRGGGHHGREGEGMGASGADRHMHRQPSVLRWP